MPNEHDQQSPPDITQQPVIDTAGQSGNQQDTSSPPPTLADISNTLWNLSRNVPTLSAADVKATTDDLLSNLKENSSYNEVQENYSKKYSNLLKLEQKKKQASEQLKQIKKTKSNKKEFNTVNTDLTDLNSKIDSAKKAYESIIKPSKKIIENNEKITASTKSIQELPSSIALLLDQFYTEAAAYTNDGISFPSAFYLSQVNTDLDVFKHALKEKYSKDETSKDLYDNFNAAKARLRPEQNYEPLQKRYSQAKQTLSDMEKYKANNERFDAEFSAYSTPFVTALNNYQNFLDIDREEREKTPSVPDTLRFMTIRKSRYLQDAQAAIKSFNSSTKQWNQFVEKFSSSNSKSAYYLSSKKKEALNRFISRTLPKFFNTSDKAKTLQKQLEENTASASQNNPLALASSFTMSYQSSKQHLSGLLDSYVATQKKWEYEEKPDSIREIEKSYDIFQTSRKDADNQLKNIPRPDAPELFAILDENTEHISKNYAIFQKKHQKLHKAHEIIKEFDITEQTPPTLMRLVWHVKNVKNEKTTQKATFFDRAGNTIKSSFLAKPFTALSDLKDKFDENHPAASAALGTAFDLGTDTASDVTDTVDGFLDDSEQSKYMEKNVPDSVRSRYLYGVNIVSTIQNGFNLFKEMISTVNQMLHGGDSRELGKSLLSLFDALNEAFDSVLGYYSEKIPIFSTVKSALTIALRIVDWVRSQKNKSIMDDKKEALKQYVKNKHERYSADGIAKDVYDFQTVSDVAGTYGFYSSQKTAANAYAKTDELAGRVISWDPSKSAKDLHFQPEKGKTSDHLLLNEEGTQSIAAKLHDLRQNKPQNYNSQSDAYRQTDEYRQYKEKKRTLKALQNMNELSIASEAKKRMRNKIHGDIKDIVQEGISIIGSFAGTFGGGAGAIAELALSIGSAAVDAVQGAASNIRTAYRNSKETFYSDDNKKKRRNQMAETMYSRLEVLADMLGDNGGINKENMTDEYYVEASEHFRNLNEDLILGLDANITNLIHAESKDEIIESMGSAFSVEGN